MNVEHTRLTVEANVPGTHLKLTDGFSAKQKDVGYTVVVDLVTKTTSLCL